MEFKYKSCTIHATAGVDSDAIVANVRIYLPSPYDGPFDETHEMEFHRDFLDEHEAIAFAHERAVAWIDEHWDAELDRPVGA
ncbi:MAG TPA: hypothetical protein VEN30_12715 [Paraburkholderia sp.]|nr:hypothetical protein [Paraburkholderia sp.]